MLPIRRTIARVIRVIRSGRGGSRRWTILEETADIVTGNNLHEGAGFDMANFDKGRFESEDVGIVKCCIGSELRQRSSSE